MTKKILICGLPGTGKTTLAQSLVQELAKYNKNVTWHNADHIRQLHNDWDFSHEGRIRQANRMKTLAESSSTEYSICDFVAPTEEIRKIVDAHYIIWMDTEKTSKYQNTNAIFQQPIFSNFIVTTKDAKFIAPLVVKDILQRL